MKPLSSYHLKDGAFLLKNVWAQRFKVLVVVIFFIFASFYPSIEGHTVEAGHAYTKYTQLQNIISMPGIERNDANQIIQSAYKYANQFEVDKKLILAVAKVESGFNKYAISSSGAYGIMQIIPVWHKEKILVARNTLGNPEIFNIDTNIFLGTWVLRECLNKHGQVNKALLCYSGQTPGYDKKVLEAYAKI